MKKLLQKLITDAVKNLASSWGIEQTPEVKLDYPKQAGHGDYAANIALPLAKKLKRNPREIAQQIVDHIPENNLVDKIEIAGPGFINFFIKDSAFYDLLKDILKLGDAYGYMERPGHKKLQIEYVSANPTGPLHVGHGRGAAFGATLANLLKVAGFDVSTEYYVNDAGRQMGILAVSIWLRYLELFNAQFAFPSNGYKGDYVIDLAQKLREQYGEKFVADSYQVFDNLYPDEGHPEGDKDKHVDSLVFNMKHILNDNYQIVHDFGTNNITENIRDDLHDFGVDFDSWYPESNLVKDGSLQRGIDALREAGCLYEKGGATWFKATEFGDEKDRVVLRDDGRHTYFAADVAYHLNKLERGFDNIIDIFGADHHGYVPRIKAFLKALGDKDKALEVMLVQFAILYRGKEKVQMSTRSGKFVTLRELFDEVGRDAARYFYVMRRPEQHLDFDLELAKAQTADNPVYYIQYAFARICSVMRQLEQKNIVWDKKNAEQNLTELSNDHEKALMRKLAKYSNVIESAARTYEPHQIAHYLESLANDFHTYYNASKFIVDNASLRDARLYMIQATRQVIQNGLSILGVSAPEVM